MSAYEVILKTLTPYDEPSEYDKDTAREIIAKLRQHGFAIVKMEDVDS